MAASKRHMNWKTVQWVGTAPVATVTLTGVSSLEWKKGGSVQKHSGDDDHYNSLVVNDFEDPSVTIKARDLNAFSGLGVGSRGTISGTHLDAKNGNAAAGGGYTVSLRGMIQDVTGGGSHKQFGEGGMDVVAESSDGLTPPLAFVSL